LPDGGGGFDVQAEKKKRSERLNDKAQLSFSIKAG
jgi:hypothetical protein